MKSLMIILSLLILNAKPDALVELSLNEAISKKYISVEFKSTGEYTGYAIDLKINNLKGKKFKLVVPSGTLLKSEIDNEQDIFVLDDQDFLVTSGEAQQFPLNGYCCQASNSAPGVNSGFSLSKCSDANMLKLANYSNGKRIDHNSRQAGLWVVTDNKSLSDIYKVERPEVKSFRKKIAEIMGLKDNWYSTVTNYELDEDRQINRNPVEVKGELNYELEKAGTIKYAVYNDNDEKIKDLSREGMHLPRAGSYGLEFRLKVEGWGKGIYSVKLSLDGVIIHSQSFEV